MMKPKMRPPALLLLTALLVGAVSSAAAGWGEKEHRFTDSFESDLDGVTAVRLVLRNGSIRVKTWDESGIDIEVAEVVKQKSRAKAEKIAGRARLAGRREGSTLVIEVDYGGLSRRDREKYMCSARVRLPRGIAVDLFSTNGSIRLDRRDADVSARTSNGAIFLDGCTGNADLKTSNGAVKVGVVKGDLSVISTNGALRLAAGAGDVSAETTNGSITVDVIPGSGFLVDAETSNGKVI